MVVCIPSETFAVKSIAVRAASQDRTIRVGLYLLEIVTRAMGTLTLGQRIPVVGIKAVPGSRISFIGKLHMHGVLEQTKIDNVCA